MADFGAIVDQMKREYGIRIRKWRRQMSGCAWCVKYSDGRSIRWIESPRPKTPISLAIFLHEVGHHAIGFDNKWPRCEEEHHVWQWTLNKMRNLDVEPDDRVLRRVELSMQYAVGKAMRRGLKNVPEALVRYLPMHPTPS